MQSRLAEGRALPSRANLACGWDITRRPGFAAPLFYLSSNSISKSLFLISQLLDVIHNDIDNFVALNRRVHSQITERLLYATILRMRQQNCAIALFTRSAYTNPPQRPQRKVTRNHSTTSRTRRPHTLALLLLGRLGEEGTDTKRGISILILKSVRCSKLKPKNSGRIYHLPPPKFRMSERDVRQETYLLVMAQTLSIKPVRPKTPPDEARPRSAFHITHGTPLQQNLGVPQNESPLN